MLVALQQLTAAIYLLAALLAGLGLALPSARLAQAAVGTLLGGAVVHAVGFAALHGAEPTPPLTDEASAISFMAWIGVVFFLLLMRRARLAGLVILVAPLAFLGVFFAALRLPGAAPPGLAASGSWPHAHVLLASAGMSLLGVAGLAGLLFLAEHRRLKAKRPLPGGVRLPSLEALDGVNAAALAVGFPLLTLGVVTGMLWLWEARGEIWTGSPHELWSAVAWVIYSALAATRVRAGQSAHQAALTAVAGFAFLLFAVVGVGLLA